MSLDRGIVASLAAAVLFGAGTPVAKILLEELSPLMLAGLLYLGSGLGLFALLGLRIAFGGGERITWPRGKEIAWWLGAILAGGAIGPYLLMRGLQATDAGSASLILNLEAVFTAWLAWFVFRENFDRRIALGMTLIVAGGCVLAAGTALRGGSSWIGPLAIAGACLAWAVDNNLTRKIALHDAMLIACVKGLLAGSASVALAMSTGHTLPNGATALRAGALGFVSYGLSLTLFVVALRSLGTARTGAYFSLAPFIGAALGVALGAPLSLALVAAGLLMAAGVWLHLTERHGHRHRHAATVHEHVHIHDEHHRHPHDPAWNGIEPHAHAHTHEALVHTHEHFPDTHHRHAH